MKWHTPRCWFGRAGGSKQQQQNPSASPYSVGFPSALASAAIGFLLAASQSLYGQNYTTTSVTTAWNTSRWSTSSSGPFTSAYTANSAVSFTSGSYQFAGMGALINVGNVTVSNNVNVFFASPVSTYATGGAVQTVDVGTGGVYDLNTQSVSTAAGTGFLKTGAGVFALSAGGNNYTGGFTLNEGTVILRGINAIGNGGALTLNGGVVAGSATRDLTGKYGGGITVGGNVQFGEFSTNVAIASDSGNLTFSNNMSLGAATRTLTLGNRGIVTYGGVIANTSGGITFAAASGAEASASNNGRFDVTNLANTFTGNLTFTGAEVRFYGDGSLGNANNDIVIDGGRFTIASGSNISLGGSRDIQIGNAAGTSISVPGTSGTLTYNNAIVNIGGKTGSWAKQGSGVLKLGGVSSYTGTTTIASGTIQLTTGNDRLPTSTVLSFGAASNANLGTLDLGGFNQTVAGLSSIVGTNSGASTNLVTTSSGSSELSISVTTGSTHVFSDGSAANSGAITGPVRITKLGDGTQIFGGSNSYTGPTTLSAGTLRGGNDSAFGTGLLTLNGGVITGTGAVARSFANGVAIVGDISFGDGTGTGPLAFSGTVGLGGAARQLTTAVSTTFSGAVTNGSLTKAGAATLSLTNASNSFGTLTVNDGTASIGANTTITGLGGSSGALNLAAGTLTFNPAADASVSLPFSGAGGFTKTGNNVLTFTGNSSTHSGPFTVSAGRLKVDGVVGTGTLSVAATAWLMGTGTVLGPVTVGGTLAPGSSPGVLTLGSLTLTSTSTTVIELTSGTLRGTDYDGVTISSAGGLTYGGVLQFAFGGSAVPDGTYDIFDFSGGSTASLASVESTGFYAGTWQTVGSGTYRLVSGTQTLTFSESSGDIIVVPEPAALTLAAIGIGAMGCCRLRRRQ